MLARSHFPSARSLNSFVADLESLARSSPPLVRPPLDLDPPHPRALLDPVAHPRLKVAPRARVRRLLPQLQRAQLGPRRRRLRLRRCIGRVGGCPEGRRGRRRGRADGRGDARRDGRCAGGGPCRARRARLLLLLPFPRFVGTWPLETRRSAPPRVIREPPRERERVELRAYHEAPDALARDPLEQLAVQDEVDGLARAGRRRHGAVPCSGQGHDAAFALGPAAGRERLERRGKVARQARQSRVERGVGGGERGRRAGEEDAQLEVRQGGEGREVERRLVAQGEDRPSQRRAARRGAERKRRRREPRARDERLEAAGRGTATAEDGLVLVLEEALTDAELDERGALEEEHGERVRCARARCDVEGAEPRRRAGRGERKRAVQAAEADAVAVRACAEAQGRERGADGEDAREEGGNVVRPEVRQEVKVEGMCERGEGVRVSLERVDEGRRACVEWGRVCGCGCAFSLVAEVELAVEGGPCEREEGAREAGDGGEWGWVEVRQDVVERLPRKRSKGTRQVCARVKRGRFWRGRWETGCRPCEGPARRSVELVCTVHGEAREGERGVAPTHEPTGD
ncbi:hypothetical protein DMC30DRAFT_405416 [Rhodotorula diobovata]|uniref:Uncharacterized protein n=1 Tax=Rhodotorula diobovata TaxID=5288 RepID=A0A5C5FN07_9BASI|nr:hypothetical protein DMC30DRAFT_405416 [Rhodotorula diobovata]